MNRVIKFRGWDGEMMFVPSMITAEGDINRPNGIGIDDWVKAELMQFTGLHDKNGKEIYEGDIRCGKYYFETEEQTRFQVMKWDEKNTCFYWDGPEIPGFIDVEVIGNIYENPELLK